MNSSEPDLSLDPADRASSAPRVGDDVVDRVVPGVGDRAVRSVGVQQALAAVWDTMAADYGLLPQLAADATLARADGDDLVLAAPRLLELLVDHRVTVEQACDITTRLGNRPWTSEQQVAIEAVLDAWWLETLMRAPGEHRFPFTPDVVLGVLAGYDAPMVRWFDPWLDELDGHGAAHLVGILLGRPVLGPNGGAELDDQADDTPALNRTPALHQTPAPNAATAPDWAIEPPAPVVPDGPAWVGKGDQARQVVAWARTETVINGLALVGGTHLDAEALSDVLDRLI